MSVQSSNDPFAQRMHVVGTLVETIERIRNNASADLLKEAISLLLDSVGQIIHPGDLRYLKTQGEA